MNTRMLCGLLVVCLLLLSTPHVIEETQALAVDKKKIMKALFLTKLALKKKKLLVVPMPIPIMVDPCEVRAPQNLFELAARMRDGKKHHQIEHHMPHHGW